MPAVNTVRIRQGTSTQWSSTNPVLGSGEPGFDTTNNLLKIGDGVSTWTALTNTASYSLLDVDNIRLDANTISSTDTNGNIILLPNGTGNIGAGTSSPSQKLHVSGNLRVTGGIYDATNNIGSSNNVLISTGSAVNWASSIDCGVVTPSAGIVLNFNGSNGSTTFTNSGSLTGVTFSTSSGATISTAQSKFGGSSLLCSGGNQWITGTADASLAHGTSDFTLEFWIYCITLTASHYFFRTSTGTGTGDGIIMGAGATPVVYIGQNGSWNIVNGLAMTGMTTGVWQHIAITRSGSTFRGFVDGTQRWTTTSALSIYQSANAFRIGAVNPSAGLGMNAYMEDFRYIAGYAAYTANFTPPTAELTSSV